MAEVDMHRQVEALQQQITASRNPATPSLLAPEEDVNEFIDKVDEMARLLDGLKSGTLPPEYIDKKLEQRNKQENQAKAKAEDIQAKQEEFLKDDKKRAELMRKVEELQANRERKARARNIYAKYVESDAGQGKYGTDYKQWDMWCPSDDEDDLFNSLTPNNPQFRAMEKDIEDRHKRMVEARQLAERHRVKGNELYSEGRWSEAYQEYDAGISFQRHNMALHANAAMASLKMGCAVQATEHCDKVLHLADALFNRPTDPLCVKALQRRATAYQMLGQPTNTVRDLEAAAEIEPDNKEVSKQLQKAREDLEEVRKQKRLQKVMEGQAGDDGYGELEKLRQVEQLVRMLQPSQGSTETPATSSSSSREAAQEAGPAPSTSAAAPHTGGQAPGTSATAAQSVGQEPTASAAAPHQAGQAPSTSAAAAQRGGQAPGGSAGPAPGGLGAGLPGPRSQRAQRKAAELSGPGPACDKLRGLLEGNDACCVYFRECGGLAAAAQQVTSLTATTTAATSSALLLLNSACHNDANLRALPKLGLLPRCLELLPRCLELLPRCLELLAGRHAAAAATLLCTAATCEDVRKELSKCIAAGQTAAGCGPGLASLMKAIQAENQQVQLLALTTLSNCMVDASTKDAMRALLQQPLPATSGEGSCAQLAQLLTSMPVAAAEKLLGMLGNMCGDPRLRAVMLQQPQLFTAVAQHALKPCSGTAAALQLPALTALYNLLVEPAAQELLVASQQVAGLAALLDHGDSAVSVRAAAALARAVKQPPAVLQLLGVGAERLLVGTVLACSQSGQRATTPSQCAPAAGATSDQSQPDQHTDQTSAATAVVSSAVSGASTAAAPSQPPPVAAALVGAPKEQLQAFLDAAARILASCLAVEADADAVVDALVAAGAVDASLWLLEAGAGEAVQGNAALALAGLAKQAHLLPTLHAKSCVPKLLDVVRAGKGNPASKNASIALARLAVHPAMLEQLGELRGMEIIYSYVKP